MHTPAAFAVESTADVLGVLRHVSFGHLVTSDADAAGPALASTALPFVVDDAVSTVRAHFARANPHWRDIDGTPALLIVSSADAYISPRWYPSKAEHGEVVPTWNYEVVHLHGTIEIHDDVEWKREMVDDLTDHNEASVRDPDRGAAWSVADAPAEFVDRRLNAIVGLQLTVTAVEASRKLSQNKPEADRVGATEGLARSDRLRDRAAADLMRSQSHD